MNLDWLERLGLRKKVIETDGNIYMERWYLRDSDTWGLMLQHICRPDWDRYLHDHPWWFASLILRGGYTESRTDRRGRVVWRRRSHFNFVRTSTFHRIEELDKNTWTLVLTGRKYQEWAYRVPFTELPAGKGTHG